MKSFDFLHNKVCSLRAWTVALLLLVTARVLGAGWTPTDIGFVINFEPGDQFLLSVMIDDDNNALTPDVEYFVCDYPSYTGGKFKYTAGNTLKLIPQSSSTVPSAVSVWTVDTALTRVVGKVNYALGGISYTVWGNSKQTLVTSDGNFKYKGALSSDRSNANLCDVVFVVPSARSTNADPSNTLGRNGSIVAPNTSFDGQMGVGYNGMVYREVYMMDIPRSNSPISYTNASLVTFNTSSSTQKWNGENVGPGKVYYAFADGKHNPTTRTLFRIYPLNKPFSSCSSFFFGWDVQDYTRYRQSNTLTDSTSARKVYALDHFECMERVGTSTVYKTGFMQVPSDDSTYYYVGKNDKYYSNRGASPVTLGPGANSYSQFTKIRQLPVYGLDGAFTPEAGAYGRMVVDTTTAGNNMGVSFEPKGYFFQTSSGVNVPMQKVDENTWITEQMWYIPEDYMGLSGRVMLYTGEKFSETDPGAQIIGWSKWQNAKDIPLYGGNPGETAEGHYGWARIYTNRTDSNGGIEFVLAEPTKRIHYDNNGFIGLQIPDGYSFEGESTVRVADARLKAGFTFIGWAASPDGPVVFYPTDSVGKAHYIGELIDLNDLPGGLALTNDTLFLYAKARFDDTYRVAFSFIEGDKRYWITHPNSSAPRFARARTFTDWTNVYQGMSDAENSQPNYVSTYKMIVYPTCVLCDPDAEDTEVVLDPRHETVHGVEDSLTFYEHWAPANDEYLGLYYTEPNTLIANNTWAGVFKSTEGWPSYRRTAVDNTKLFSTEYFTGLYDRVGIERKRRAVPNTSTPDPNDSIDLPAYVKYESGQFNGVDEGEATQFQITGIAVADAHYVILPDTANTDAPWVDALMFDYHDEAQQEVVWSPLIGKQLMACLRVGPDTVYFHPNDNKTLTTANELRLSLDYRLTQAFTLIHDQRPAAAVVDSAMTSIEETDDGFSCRIVSGKASPIVAAANVDIVDTLRVWLRPASTCKIKNYYGRWSDSQVDSVLRDGSRYRDILVKTKAYHYGDTKKELVLDAKEASYGFGALANQSKEIQFTLTRVTYKELLDAEGNFIRKEIISTNDTTAALLRMYSGWCTLTGSGFAKVDAGISNDHVTVKTVGDNQSSGANSATLTVTIPANTFTGFSEAIIAQVPLTQSSMQGDELIWSIKKSGTRYFILANSTQLITRDYTLRDNTLYKKNTTTALVKGSKDASNNDTKYITPWKFAYTGTPNQLTLSVKLPNAPSDSITKNFVIQSGTNPTVADSTTTLTYELVGTNANDNANYEEKVILRYGLGQWLRFNGSTLELTPNENEADTFSWSYMQQEYNLLNNGDYPSLGRAEFGYNNTSPVAIKTAYKAYREYSMLLDGALTYLCRETEADYADLTSAPWSTTYSATLVPDARDFDGSPDPTSGLTRSTTGFTTTITPSGDSPIGVTIDSTFVNIVDTLQVTMGTSRTDYRFTNWKGVESTEDACLKIPLVRKTYHSAPYDSIVCAMNKEEYNFAFPSTLSAEDSLMTFHFTTTRRRGTNVLDVDNKLITSTHLTPDTLRAGTTASDNYDLSSTALAEIRLVDEYGNKPDWCEVSGKTPNTVTVKCLKNGVRSPRTAHLYFAYIVTYIENAETKVRYVNFKFTVSQASLFQYTNNQTLIHMPGASGDPLTADGRQQVHENKRILYYYNPQPYADWDETEELPVRERGFYGWWRWYQENEGAEDTDIPDTTWLNPPRNIGKYNYPFRIIGDSVDDGKGGKTFLTMGRYTVFHYPSKGYGSKQDPPAKSPHVKAPWNKDTVTYVVDISNYTDNLPLSMVNINQVDTAVLDTLREIFEPTLSIREIFELHPWTEMAQKLDGYKSAIPNRAAPNEGYTLANEHYMEDHEVMAPIGNRLLLSTEQRYNYKNITAKGHSESLMGYYMRDDNWATWSAYPERQDTMIWEGGWDADCDWYIYTPSTGKYTKCNYSITVDDDFLDVPAKTSITGGAADTVYYCLRARSRATTGTAPAFTDEATTDGGYWFNICRYKVMYHDPRTFGPFEEKGSGNAAKAIITNDEIEQNYEVLERLNFDYVKPGNDYYIYPHPLPWSDASYGYTYPVGPEIPNNRYHDEKDFPGPGEYAIINKIPYSTYWRKFEQHGGAENGFMIYCDGMSSAGQVAALTLNTQLCEGQRMYFSGYIANVSNQTGKSNPNFTFSVQGWDDRVGQKKWVDITSYMTGDIQPSDKWSQIFFPITQEGNYDQFRIRIYNVASDFDGNDFIIDDMCVFATKPPLVAYQADTKCLMEGGKNDSLTNVVLRLDYQGFVDQNYNGANVFYTVQQSKDGDTTFVKMEDGYFFEDATHVGADESKPDTIFGYIPMPSQSYVPVADDSIFTNLQQLVQKFEASVRAREEWTGAEEDAPALFRQGYLYENLDGKVRPVLYVIHQAKMSAEYGYTIRLAIDDYKGLLNSKCAVTSRLKVSNRMVLELNGEEVETQVTDMCANTTYDLSLRIKESLLMDSVAPIDVNGSCVNDWLLYGDTSEVSSVERYGYRYSDIKKVIKDILRINDDGNGNRLAPNLASVNRNVMKKMQTQGSITFTTPGHTSDHPYDILAHLVNNGFLTLYQSKLTTTVSKGDSIQYVIFPIEGTGSKMMNEKNIDVCTTPMFIKLKPDKGGSVPMTLGGIQRDSTQLGLPVVILANARTANEEFKVHIDSMMPQVAIHSISLLSTDDPDFYEGVHLLNLEPDKIFNFGSDMSGYYKKGDDIYLHPASSNNYQMRQGYNYTFGIMMQTMTGSLTSSEEGSEGCAVGTVPFTVSIVPDYLLWSPSSPDNNKWNDPKNWIGVDANMVPIHENAHFAPMGSTDVIIPALRDGLPYPEIPASIASTDSVKQVNFVYNTCDDIRFLPGAAIRHQQRLGCDVAVVDMTIPRQTWAFRAAPVTGMLSGDIFVANSDLSGENKPWYVGEFDANGRNYQTGNASFWMSLYNSTTVRINNGYANDTTHSESADWSKVTNGMTLSLPPAKGFAIYARPTSGDAVDVRLPKSDDIYYYYDRYGEKLYDQYESNLRALRSSYAGAAGAGKLAFYPGAEATSQTYTLNNAVSSASFVFGNPAMGYIDIWGFIADNDLVEEFSYLDESGNYTTVTKSSGENQAAGSKDTISNQWRYLPPMHAIMVTAKSGATSLAVELKTKRIVTSPSQVETRFAAPRRSTASGLNKGIMTVTAVNPVSSRCVSRLLIGQGYDKAIISGEDAILTTVNIDKFHMTNTPTTPFNIYAAEGGYGLSIDLRDSVLNVPLSFYLTRQDNLSFAPTTSLWFTGVNSIDGQLVLYDALMGTERDIIDGICLEVETPEVNHEKRYYIRRKGFNPAASSDQGAPTGIGSAETDGEQAVKIVRNGHVLVIRNGHVYTLFGQKIR